MKRIVYLLGIALLVFSCSPKNEYVINGTVSENLEGQMVYMLDYETSQAVDSTMINEGQFTFKGEADPTRFMRVEDSGRRYFSNVILEKGTTFISLDDPFDISGTPLNEAYRDYNIETRDFYNNARQKMGEIREEYADNPEVMQEKMTEYSAEVEEKSTEISMKYYLANLDNAVSGTIFTSIAYGIDPDKVDDLYSKLGDKIKQKKQIRSFMESNEKIKQTREGSMFTDFTIENGNPDGSTVSFSDYVGKGKYVLVDFWASWCGPCIGEFPVLRETYNKYKGDKFELLGVAVWDQRDKSVEAIQKHNITWPVILDAQQIPTDIYGIRGIPQIILFGPDGTIIARNLRGEAIKTKLAELL